MTSFGDKLDDLQNDPNEYLTVHHTYIRPREFSSKKKIARNIGTHFRCKLWMKFRPKTRPIKRYDLSGVGVGVVGVSVYHK